jgi:hypothetical protein
LRKEEYGKMKKKYSKEELERMSEFRILGGGFIAMVGVLTVLVTSIVFRNEPNQLTMIIHHPFVGFINPLCLVLVGWFCMYRGLKLLEDK